MQHWASEMQMHGALDCSTRRQGAAGFALSDVLNGTTSANEVKTLGSCEPLKTQVCRAGTQVQSTFNTGPIQRQA